jgi:hypothetical protein
MRIQFCSDLHLEVNSHVDYNELLEPVAPVLALLGDIGDPESVVLDQFIGWCCLQWKQVLYVPGNHEFWRVRVGSTKTIPSALAALRALEKKYPRLCIMWRQKLVSEDGVVILGTPLWSRPAEGVTPHESEKAWIDHDRTFDAATMSRLHQEDLDWLKQEFRIARQQIVVVLTHYAPSMLLINRDYIGKPEATLYANDLDSLLRPPVVAWACGHVHQAVEWQKGWELPTGESGAVLLTTNPRGYKNDHSGWRKDAVLRIDPSILTQVEDEYLSGMSYKTL